MQFMDGDTPIGQAVVLVNGVATMGHTFDKVGAHPDYRCLQRCCRILRLDVGGYFRPRRKRPRPATVAADPVIFFRSVPDLRALLAEEYSCL